MFASQSDHPSWFTKERREQTSNVHSKGGNFVFCDGHADYRKYWDRKKRRLRAYPSPDENQCSLRTDSGKHDPGSGRSILAYGRDLKIFDLLP